MNKLKALFSKQISTVLCATLFQETDTVHGKTQKSRNEAKHEKFSFAFDPFDARLERFVKK